MLNPVKAGTRDGPRPGIAFVIPTWSYSYSLAGRISGKWALRSTATIYTYDGAGQLTTRVEGATTRRYAYDAGTNRCGLAASCESGWVYVSGFVGLATACAGG